ncbi:elongator complex protein 1-like [Anopheles ziemanni]|uniref:elongator complex protein 1-like n=1 Tax=Anopheles ziemanni TaxID=345580 RepID=UPI00265E8F5A|nr:elongator complex protein 1-like [Anopheles ziemanni]
MIAVIDGTKLRLSSYRRSIIPPPMCNYTLTLPQGPQGEVPTCVNAVGFIRYPGKSVSLKEDVSANAFFVVDSYNVITFYDLKVTKQCKDSGPMRTVSSAVNTLLRLSPLRDPFCQTSDSLLNCLWINPDNFVLSCNNYLVALCSKEGPEDYQDYVSIEKNSKEPFVDNETIGSVEALGPDKVLIELTSGRIMEVGNFIVGKRCTPYNKFSTKLYGTIPEFCEQLFVSKQQATTHVYAFSESHRNLYHNGSLVASDVTSVFHAKTYLLFTTRTELKFVPLQDRPGFTIIGERPLERLRGDLEAINPHNLSLSFIAKRLEALEYQEAFKIMRKERINLNLLVDDDPERFLAHLRSHFLPQITNVSWLNLFITDLANEDVCRTLYESNYPGWQLAPVNLASVSSGGYAVEGKIQFICDRLLDVMDSNPTILTQPKITCHVKQGQLEKALSLIWALKRDQPTPELAEQALRYLLSLIEPNVLYDVALGMYDLDLVRFVADISKKNSKEYLSFLNALKRQNEHYRKFRIDCHLKRYNRAVAHISHIKTTKERSREVMELIFNHGLYTVGIEHFRTSGNEENLRKICEQYAGHLRTTGKHAEYLNQLITALSSDKEQFLHQKERLAVVRELRERAHSWPAVEDEGDYGECDLLSDSSTDACPCRRSGQPQRSAKKRRIEKRKLVSLKEGSPFEDLALIVALHQLILRVCRVERQQHIRSICQVAFELDFHTEARTIQRDYEGFIQLIQNSMDAIWIPEMLVRGRLRTCEAATGKISSTLLQPHAAQRYALLGNMEN